VTSASAAARTAVRQGATVLAPQAIGRAATLALYDELALSPKPGLVTLTDAGSHTDMDARTFMRSLSALRGYFVRIAALGAEGAPFEELQRCGIDAEARMLAATGGINTHRGAVFMLGLLCAAAGAAAVGGQRLDPALLRDTLLARWGGALEERSRRAPTLPGGIAARRMGCAALLRKPRPAFRCSSRSPSRRCRRRRHGHEPAERAPRHPVQRHRSPRRQQPCASWRHRRAALRPASGVRVPRSRRRVAAGRHRSGTRHRR
jgi:hypothetical protein